jgi:DNA replication ATP-dependent helicase Dna2
VLVGDHNQLPPLVVNAEAEREGLGHSLFRTLSEAHPQVLKLQC